jgi:hypothetical protein
MKIFSWFIGLFYGLLLSGGQAHGAKVFNILKYGAVSDSISLNTRSIQQAIDDAAGQRGQVLVPKGVYVTGTLVLKSGVELHLEEGAVLLGSTKLEDYPAQQIDRVFYGKEWKNKALIFAQKQKDISITGKGTIDGRGHFFWPLTDQKPDRYYNRPYGLLLVECTNVLVQEVRLRNSAYWMQHYMACERLRIEGIQVYNHANQNNDGLDVDGCQNVLIRNVVIDSDDDALCFKSLSPTPCRNIRVRNVVLSSHCNAFKLGTESTGGFEQFRAHNVRIQPSVDTVPHFGSRYGDGGIALQIVDGGIMRDIQLKGFDIVGPRSPLSIRLGHRARPYRSGGEPPQQGSMEGIRIRKVKAQSFDSIGSYLIATGDGRIKKVRIVDFEQRVLAGRPTSACVQDERAQAYPEGKMYGVLPAYGLYVHKVEQLSLRRCNLYSAKSEVEQRAPLVYFQSTFRSLKKLKAQGRPFDARQWKACKGM